MEREKKTAYAALDIGTSQVKLGVYCPWLSGEIIPLGNLSNEVQYGPAGQVRAEYAPVREKSFRLFGELGRDDRLIGPALLALRHGIPPEGLLAGILAAFAYRDPGTGFTVAEVVREKGPDFVLADICGLAPEEPLFGLLKEKILTGSPHGT